MATRKRTNIARAQVRSTIATPSEGQSEREQTIKKLLTDWMNPNVPAEQAGNAMARFIFLIACQGGRGE